MRLLRLCEMMASSTRRYWGVDDPRSINTRLIPSTPPPPHGATPHRTLPPPPFLWPQGVHSAARRFPCTARPRSGMGWSSGAHGGAVVLTWLPLPSRGLPLGKPPALLPVCCTSLMVISGGVSRHLSPPLPPPATPCRDPLAPACPPPNLTWARSGGRGGQAQLHRERQQQAESLA